jgi:hypothetical protein
VRAQQPIVDKLVLDGTIQPVSAGMLKRATSMPIAMARLRC